MTGYNDIKNCLFDIFNISKEENRHFELLLKAKLNELLYLLYYHQYVIKNILMIPTEKTREFVI